MPELRGKKEGTLTAYGLACGYVEVLNLEGERTRCETEAYISLECISPSTPTYRVVWGGRYLRKCETFHKLSEARKCFEAGKKTLAIDHWKAMAEYWRDKAMDHFQSFQELLKEKGN